MNQIPGRYDVTHSILRMEAIHSWLSLSEAPDRNSTGFWFLPTVKTPKAYCFVRDSVLQMVEDRGSSTELSTEPSEDDLRVSSRPLSMSSSLRSSHHCFCHACLQTTFEIGCAACEKQTNTYAPGCQPAPAFR